LPDLSLASMTSWGGYRFRSLRLVPGDYQHGCDVFALQCGLRTLGMAGMVGEPDGIFGPKTQAGVDRLQEWSHLKKDGIAGLLTQRQIADRIALDARARLGIPIGLLHGQLEHESSFQLGVYTPPYENASRDLGVAQCNSGFHHAFYAFNPAYAIETCAQRFVKYHDLFEGVVGKRRRIELAAGAWNAPAFVCYLANEEGGKVPVNQTRAPSVLQRQKIEAYMDAVTTYLRI
jgi:hypothetical protein